ncbi:MAG: hypothetical protein J6X18_00985, partial [Bacteroidales bacterium]|nr:hypothetical protein [Bacteroidales bacterium]
HRNVLQTKFGQLLFVETENDSETSKKETYVYTMDGKYLTLIKAYWWDKDGIYAELNKERVEDIIYDKLDSNKQTVTEKVASTVEAINRLGNDKLSEEAETLLEHVKTELKR